MRPAYLTGEQVYLRAMLSSDKETATAWFKGPFPVNAARAETWLQEIHTDPWSGNKPRQLVIAQCGDDLTVGGVSLSNRGHRRGMIQFSMAPWLTADAADALRAEALRLLIPWIRDDLELMVVSLFLAADETATRAAAEELGMLLTATLREFYARPGGRVDQLVYQALNTPWRVADA